MEQKILTCIGCPLGCQIQVELIKGEVFSMTGNNCKRGEEYAKKEITAPTRIVTSTVKVMNGKMPVVSVKTKSDIPKDAVWECVKSLKEVVVFAPVFIGDVVLTDVAGTGVDVVATRNVESVK